MERKVKIETESRVFNISCMPLIECQECKAINPPDESVCVECNSHELYDVGLRFEDDIGYAWSGLSEITEGKPSQNEAIDFATNSLEAHADLYKALNENGWELTHISESGAIEFMKREADAEVL